jgi:hypothetical protein
MKQETVQETETPKLNPCQLKKLSGSGVIACSLYCAFLHECPVFFIDSHDMPVIGPVPEKYDLKWSGIEG